MSIHSVYLVSDLEDSDNGDPLNEIICRNCKPLPSRSSAPTVAGCPTAVGWISCWT